ncbi:MAG: hypothetical protein RR900_03200 [Ruthenibacterium sp.]
MPNKGFKKNLLDSLKEAAGCDYLSDLHSEIYQKAVWSALQKIDAECFTAKEWREAAQYLTQNPIDGATAQEIKNTLCGIKQI